MPRPLRPIDDGLIYDVINRCNNRRNVFHKEADLKAFLSLHGCGEADELLDRLANYEQLSPHASRRQRD